MYNIVTERFGIFTKIKLINETTGEYVAIVPEFGGNVAELILSKDEDQYSVIDGCNNYKELLEDTQYKSAELAPFPNRISNGEYQFQKKSYKLPINEKDSNHALHGFIYDKKFVVTDQKSLKDEATAVLKYKYNGDVEGYPFSFEIEKNYSLGERDLYCSTVIRNTGSGKMPIGHGWHPYFRLGKKVDKLMLQLPKSELYEVDEKLIPTGKRSAYKKFSSLELIGDEVFDSGFKIIEKGDRCFTVIHDPAQQITLKIWQDIDKNKYQFLQIYTPPARTSIAVEPMTCAVNAFNNEEGLMVLDKGEEIEMSYGVILE